MLRLVVLISGVGSNLQALIDAQQAQPDLVRDHDTGAFTIVAVGADRDAPGLGHAATAGIPAFRVDYDRVAGREAWGRRLIEVVDAHHPDVVVLSGLMRIVPAAVVAHFGGRLINTHPALLPAFPGAHAVRDALAAGVAETGATVHVVDDGVDTGPVLAQTVVAVESDDDEATLHERIKRRERELLVDTLYRIARGELDLRAAASRPALSASSAPKTPTSPYEREAS